jgi:hypothetical protein
MKKVLLSLLAGFLATASFSQSARDWMLGVNVDLIKSNQHGYFERTQAGAEVNYFLVKELTATGGLEYWTEQNQPSLVIGGRWYPVPEAYVRLRGLVGANDLSIGGGWAKPYRDQWRFEAMGDIYADGFIAIRAGFAYIFKAK